MVDVKQHKSKTRIRSGQHPKKQNRPQMLSLLASASSPLLSPPLPQVLETLPSSDSDRHNHSSRSLLIIAAILLFVSVASAAIHLLLRYISRPSSSSSSSTSTSYQDRGAMIDSLPRFSVAVGGSESSPHCAVCLSSLRPSDELRLLPTCHHAFHSPCIAAWLRSNPSCPLCRSAILLPPPPPPPHPPPPPADPSTRVFLCDDHPATAPPQATRPSSLGPSVEQLEPAKAAETAGGGGKGWLKEYVDRLGSSASSSFSSLRFSSLGSRRFGSHAGSWDLDGDVERSGGAGRSASNRWSTAAHS